MAARLCNARTCRKLHDDRSGWLRCESASASLETPEAGRRDTSAELVEARLHAGRRGNRFSGLRGCSPLRSSALLPAASRLAVAWVDRCGCGRKISRNVVHIPVEQGVSASECRWSRCLELTPMTRCRRGSSTPRGPRCSDSFVRDQRRIADQAEANLLQAAVAVGGDALGRLDRRRRDDAGIRYGDTGMPVAGAGAPLVAEFAITEFAAAIGVSTDAGKRYVGARPRAASPAARGCGAASSTATCGRGWPGGSPTRPCCSRRRPRRSWTATWLTVAHKIGPVQLERAGGGGDRDAHAGPGRGTTLGEGRGPVLHGRAAADLLRRHRRGPRRARPGRRPRPRTGRRRPRRPAEGPGLGGLAGRPPGGRGRRARPRTSWT